MYALHFSLTYLSDQHGQLYVMIAPLVIHPQCIVIYYKIDLYRETGLHSMQTGYQQDTQQLHSLMYKYSM